MSSVKVAVRVRPFNEREKGSKVCIVMVSYIALVRSMPNNVSDWFLEWPHNSSCGPKHGRGAPIYIWLFILVAW